MTVIKTRLIVGLVLAAAIMSGCRGGSASLRGGADDQTILLERAQAYWGARFAQDMQQAFAFEDPLRQKRLNLVQYIRLVGEPGKVYAVTVKGVKILGDQADVEVAIKSRPPFGTWAKNLLTSTITDDWQKIDGVWYHVLDLHMIRDGKPRVNVERGTIDYPSAGKPEVEGGRAAPTDAAAGTAPPER